MQGLIGWIIATGWAVHWRSFHWALAVICLLKHNTGAGTVPAAGLMRFPGRYSKPVLIVRELDNLCNEWDAVTFSWYQQWRGHDDDISMQPNVLAPPCRSIAVTHLSLVASCRCWNSEILVVITRFTICFSPCWLAGWSVAVNAGPEWWLPNWVWHHGKEEVM